MTERAGDLLSELGDRLSADAGEAGLVAAESVRSLAPEILKAEKDGSVVKWTGRVVGAVLVIIGLSGLLCGAVNHALKNRPSSCRMASGAPDTKLPPGHPPIGPSQK